MVRELPLQNFFCQPKGGSSTSFITHIGRSHPRLGCEIIPLVSYYHKNICISTTSPNLTVPLQMGDTQFFPKDSYYLILSKAGMEKEGSEGYNHIYIHRYVCVCRHTVLLKIKLTKLNHSELPRSKDYLIEGGFPCRIIY